LRYLIAILSLGLLFVSGVSAADTTIAVLLLQQGASSDAYEGLGRALAGMLLADLPGVDGLVLVERARLDAVVSEIDLSKTGFLDPSTAQKLGKGLGAQDVVIGSWSVVRGRFLMDARLVEVHSGRVVKAAKADGDEKDFVAVEKQVVRVALAGLQQWYGLEAKRCALPTRTRWAP